MIMLFVLFVFPICYLCMYLFIFLWNLIRAKQIYCKAMKLKRGTNFLFMHVLFLRECFILKYCLYSKLLDFLYVFLFCFFFKVTIEILLMMNKTRFQGGHKVWTWSTMINILIENILKNIRCFILPKLIEIIKTSNVCQPSYEPHNQIIYIYIHANWCAHVPIWACSSPN